MKYMGLLSLVLAPIFLASTGHAQTADQQAVNKPSDAVAAARCQYTPAEGACPRPGTSGDHQQDAVAQSQFPRRIPVARRYSRRPMGPPPSYRPMWSGPDDGRSTAIGGLIGFGLGALAGVKANSDQHARAGVAAALLGGGLGACFGAAIGHAIGAFPHPYRRRPWPDDEDEQAVSGARVQGLARHRH